MKHENIRYIHWIKEQNCCHCGAPADDPHHVIGIGAGIMGAKASDIHAVPLCREHHEWIHRELGKGGREKIAATSMEFRWLLQTQDRAQAEGML